MANLNTIKNWFRTGLKPTQAQFWDTWDSFWHKDDKLPITSINGLDDRLATKAEAEAFNGHLADTMAHKVLFDAKAEKIHTHTIAEVTGLQGALGGKAGVSHVNDADAHSELLAVKADKSNVYTIAEVDGKLTSVMAYKGNVATVVALPNVGNKVGDTYNVSADGMNYAWNGTTWDALGGQVDLSAYYLKTATDALLEFKSPLVHSHTIADVAGLQDKLNLISSGTNTIEAFSPKNNAEIYAKFQTLPNNTSKYFFESSTGNKITMHKVSSTVGFVELVLLDTMQIRIDKLIGGVWTVKTVTLT